ncbi:hypothetical protein LTR84_012301 [Exophiala bonariae]|uniref:Uncharacterized protein n=1 Tax=Exophiala bonariae TaxID=1690606 RepID=A0AAV9NFV0_9EURO|nr:hypothetical protein LTR84_012301 [Exophiala bonariae]
MNASALYMSKLSDTEARISHKWFSAALQHHSATIEEYESCYRCLVAEGKVADIHIVIPRFEPTAEPEFDQLLADVRQKIFMPAALSQQHQQLIYKRRHFELLNKDPGVTVTMDDGEEIRLRTTNAFEKPSRSLYLRQFLSQLEEGKSNWNNVLPFLQGLVMARALPPDYYWAQLTRKAGEAGKEGVLLDCANSAEKTEFRLCRPGVARELFIAFHQRAAADGFKDATLEKVWTRAHHVALMLEAPEHRPRNSLKGPRPMDHTDARSEPTVLATLLELSSHMALEHQTQTLKTKAASYASKLAIVIQDPPPSRPEASKDSKHAEMRKMAFMSEDMETGVIIGEAIRTALKLDAIKGDDKATLKDHLPTLNKKLNVQAKILRTEVESRGPGRLPTRRALLMYDQLHS